MMSGLNLLSIAEARDGLAKDFTAGELIEDCLRAMEAEDLNAVRRRPIPRAIKLEADARRAKGGPRGRWTAFRWP